MENQFTELKQTERGTEGRKELGKRNNGNIEQEGNQADGSCKSLHINNYSKCKLNSPIKRHRMAGLKKKRQLYAVYKRLTSALTHIGLKWRDGRRYYLQVKTKRAGITVLALRPNKLSQEW